MDDLKPISNQDQRVDTRKYDSNFERIFGEPKKGMSGNYVYRNGQWILKDKMNALSGDC